MPHAKASEVTLSARYVERLVGLCLGFPAGGFSSDTTPLSLRGIPPIAVGEDFVLPYSTVTLFARFLGLSTSVPMASAV
jgi:hypothetical protein